MKQEREHSLSISAIYKTWLSAQNKKHSNLDPANHKSINNKSNNNHNNINHNSKSQNSKSQNSKRQKSKGKHKAEQEYFHVFVRGYSSYTIFYDNQDRVHFLLILDQEAKKYKARISAFILMDNHFHLQIITSQLSSLMRSILYRYSRRTKNKYGIEGPIFEKSYGRSHIYSYLIVKENLLYILSNASRENMCATHRDYIWSSYNSHPEIIEFRRKGMLPLPTEQTTSKNINNNYITNPIKKAQLQSPKRRRGVLPSKEKIAKTDINQLITIDTSIMVKAYKNLEELDYSIHIYKPLKEQLIDTPTPNNPIPNTIHTNYINRKYTTKFIKLTPDAQVARLFLNILKGRKLNTITENERIHIINKLKREIKATKRQISSILRI